MMIRLIGMLAATGCLLPLIAYAQTEPVPGPLASIAQNPMDFGCDGFIAFTRAYCMTT